MLRKENTHHGSKCQLFQTVNIADKICLHEILEMSKSTTFIDALILESDTYIGAKVDLHSQINTSVPPM